MLSSCGQETLSGGEPNPGGLCSKKRTSHLLNRVAGSLGEGWRGTSSCGRPVGSLPPGTPAAPFLSIRLPLPPPPTLLTSHFTPSPSSCSPRPHLCRVKHPTNFSGPGSLIGEVGVGWPGCRLPFAWPCFCSPVTLAQPSHPIFHCSGKPGCTARSQQSLAPSPPPPKGLHRPGTLQAGAQWAERLPKV